MNRGVIALPERLDEATSHASQQYFWEWQISFSRRIDTSFALNIKHDVGATICVNCFVFCVKFSLY